MLFECKFKLNHPATKCLYFTIVAAGKVLYHFFFYGKGCSSFWIFVQPHHLRKQAKGFSVAL